MATVTQLISEEQKDAFDEFYYIYPHNPSRRAKAKARALFEKITAPGGITTRSFNKDSGLYEELHLEATPEQIIEAAKRFRRGLIPKGMTTYTPDTTYAPYAYVWLNQGRFEDE